jgi:DNA invertase Pin-like site-specific DNA recombinase
MRFKPTNIIKPGCFMAGLYGRLSDEDRGKVNSFMESESIKNQRDYLHYTVKQLNDAKPVYPVEIYGEYYDDDYTGITFDRPNFRRMLKEVEEGRLDCIIVKDFSRFGRDYIRIIRYLEKDFEIKNHEIRFVAYSDHYDSLTDKPDIGVRILLFLNEEYSRSQSHKVTTGMESMMRAGKFIGAFAPYGYRKDPKDKHHLLVDEEVGNHVRDIFRMNRMEGLGVTEIARRLNEQGIEPPAVYKEKQGLNYRCGARLTTSVYWTADTITRILQDEKYTGTMVQHQTATKDFKRKEIVLVSEEDWIKVSNTHEAIISREEFEAVRQLHKAVPKNRNIDPDSGLFSGVIKCGDCLHALIKHTEKYKDSRYQSYQCRTHKRDSSRCYVNRIYEKHLSDIILEDLNKIIAKVSNLDTVIPMNKSSRIDSRSRAISCSLVAKREELHRYQALEEGAREKWFLGKLDDEEYEQIRNRYRTEQDNIKREILVIQSNAEEAADNSSERWIEALQKHGYVDKLSREMIVEAIDSIYLYQDGRLVINYKFSKDLEVLFLPG